MKDICSWYELALVVIATITQAEFTWAATIRLTDVRARSTDSIWYRDFTYNKTITDNITSCITNITSVPVIVDGYGNFLTLWVDTGSYDIDTVDVGIEEKLVTCIRNMTGMLNVWVHGHNSYAFMGSYDDKTYYQHFNYFGHGEPANYDKDDPGSWGSPSSDSGEWLVEQRKGNSPDRIKANRIIFWADALIATIFNNHGYRVRRWSLKGFNCDNCVSSYYI